jgi:hypothetical protein
MKPAEPLHPHEWNFDEVPDSELVACCYWEYARESPFICSTLQRYGERLAGRRPDTDAEVEEIQRNEQMLLGMGYALEVFIPDQFSNREPDAPPSLGGFPKPWQALSIAQRKARSPIRRESESPGIAPVQLARSPCGESLARAWEAMYKRSLIDGSPCRFSFRTGPTLVNGVPCGLRFWEGKTETLLIEIAWGHFSNDEIAEYFRKWVSGARSRHFPNPKKTGHTRKHDRRAALRDLGVMRLLNFSTVANLKNRGPVAADHFTRLGWLGTDRQKNFSAARKRALRNFRDLFPFLPEGELPMHATTKGGRGKL